MTPEQFKAWAVRLGLSEAAMAAYLGVPVPTYRKWENGTRKPDAAPLRLFQVLQMVETFGHGDAMHRHLIEEARASAPDRPVAAPKGRGRGKGAPGPKNAPTVPESIVLGVIPAGTLVTPSLVRSMIGAASGPADTPASLPDWMKGNF